jgi:hypothetical protein
VPPFWNGDPTFLDSRVRQRVKEAAALPAPLWIGELGYDLTKPGAISYIDAALDEADRQGVGWAWWQWRENRYWGIVDAGGRLVNGEALRHLARPYLIAAPAGVQPAVRVESVGRISLVVDRSHADQAVTLGWSGLGPGVPRATGGCLKSSAWDSAAGRLTLELVAAAGCTVTVASISAG